MSISRTSRDADERYALCRPNPERLDAEYLEEFKRIYDNESRQHLTDREARGIARTIRNVPVGYWS